MRSSTISGVNSLGKIRSNTNYSARFDWLRWRRVWRTGIRAGRADARANCGGTGGIAVKWLLGIPLGLPNRRSKSRCRFFLEIKEDPNVRGVITATKHRLLYTANDCSDVGTMWLFEDVSISTINRIQNLNVSLLVQLVLGLLKKLKRSCREGWSRAC